MPSTWKVSSFAATITCTLRRALIAGVLAFLIPLSGSAQSVDWKAVDAAMGRSGSAQPGDVYKFGMPRTDLTVRIDDLTLKPAFALGSWVAFKCGGDHAMAMGDLVLVESEVDPVMQRLESGGVRPTALHNHVLGESPRIVYLHIEAHGDPVTIARTIRAALDLTGTPPPRIGPPSPLEMNLDTAMIASRLGYHGKANNGVFQVAVPRAETIRSDGMEIPPTMGVATAINFQAIPGGRAAVTGDFVLAADEVDAVLVALLAHGVAVTALHSHMLTEQPRLLFMHFWAIGAAAKLAEGLRAALAQMKVVAPTP